MNRTVPSDVDIAQAHKARPIADIAREAGIPADALIPYGTTKAKIDLSALAALDDAGTAGGHVAPTGSPGATAATATTATTTAPAPDDAPHRPRLVLVSAMSPTPAGEGKSTVLIGLTDAVAAMGLRAATAIREPSQGPVMGLKGGACGGGYAQIVPMEDINLHFTGDFHAIAAATNTLAALIDNHIHQGNRLRIDPRTIRWQRCLDVNDRSLRNVVTGLGGPTSGVPRETGFTITAASELMAVHGLAASLEDFSDRVSRILVGFTFDGDPVTAGDIGAVGALTALMRDAVNPNLVQTLGGSPAFVHGGPFANIAHGCNTLAATQTAMRFADVVLTEAGFGSDLGAEKFFDLKARAGGLEVDGCVLVATIRSLKRNGGADLGDLAREDVSALRRGVANLERHISVIRSFGVEPVVALNLFSSDTRAERDWLRGWAAENGVAFAEADVWARGGAGAAELADTLMEVMDRTAGARSHPLYDPADGIEASIATLAQRVYGAASVEYSPQAWKDLALLRRHGWDRLPVCVSKTPYSFSDDPSAIGAASGHVLHVRELLPRLGAGFVVALTGSVMTMPGLPKSPAAEGIAVSPDGRITGLF
ncbi:formate--tetrahydrofolate ligase [Corynebacterium sp.]|uniref:formate--tetrahydrofolate ligase n=1 Tax=Corynebacterium sp. TaxID=1720 RepID=UPI0026DB59AC|nr:formate--tetrahydrofolate ligase [Corynebacterium sp.]MDO4610059.1 formate--tetrahydrofolate ligase [Corynebacterium sp.]